jgi:NADPH-dependent 2,4-dienoyl-CoA reductase/sulfur reductase-like enzyme
VRWDYCIIGADAAGLSAAIQIKRLRPQASLKVISKGPTISYAACGIPYVISGEIASPQKLVHFTPESFAKKRGILVETGKEAVSVHAPDHVVEVKDLETGETFPEEYAKLLVATGASPIRLPFIDYHEDGIFHVHTIEDLTHILGFLEKQRPLTAAIIGAGNIGLELAEALKKRGLDVIILELLPEPAVLWPARIRRTVLKKIEEKNIRLHAGTAVREVRKAGRGFVLESKGGRTFEADAIFSVVGTVPATQFCRAELEMEKNGAIKIDRRGQTSDPDIFAAGDCATVYHRLLQRNVYFPLGSTANKMGRIAGINMAGGEVDFPGIVGTQILKFFELSLAKTGLSLEEAEKEGIRAKIYAASRRDKAVYYPGAAMAEVEVVCETESGKTIGAAAICEGNAAQFIDPAAVAVFTGMDISDLGWFDSAYAPPYAPVWNALISAALKASSAEDY